MAITTTRSRSRRQAPSPPRSITADIITPAVNDRVYQHFERVQGPKKVEQTLQGALNGDPLPQMLLFNAMVDTWPDLGQALNQVADEAAKAPLEIAPYAEEGEEPSALAQDKAAAIRQLKKSMRPDLRVHREGWHGTLKGLAFGYYYGLTVREVFWEQTDDGIFPSSTAELDPVYYRYPLYGDQEDQLLFSPTGRTGGVKLEQFDPNKFLIGENRWHRGSALQTAPLRALVGYWLAANYGMKWMMQFAQVYGIPFRMGTYPDGDEKAKYALNDALANLGAAGYASAPAGTTIDVTAIPSSASALPQKELIDMADKAVAKFILGQTLTSDVGNSGSRALGDVHEKVRRGRIESAVYFVSSIVNSQLVPAVVGANWPDCSELPTISADWPDDEDGLKKVERDKTLFGDLGLPVAKKDLYERHNVRQPEADEELFKPTTSGTPDIMESGPSGAKGSPPRAVSKGVEPGRASTPSDDDNADLAKAGRITVQAAATINTATLEALQNNVADLVPNVAREWLAPAEDLFSGLVKRALGGETTEEEFGRVLAEAAALVPDLELDNEALETALTNAVGTAMLAGAGQKALDLPATITS